MTNLFIEADDINARPWEHETPRADNPLRKYTLQDIPTELLDNLKKVERGAHLRHQELDFAVILCDHAEDHQDASEAALLKAMILAESLARVLDEEEKAAVEEFNRSKKVKGEKAYADEKIGSGKAALDEKTKCGNSQVKYLDVGPSCDKCGKGKGKSGKKWMGAKEEDKRATAFWVFIIICVVLYRMLR